MKKITAYLLALLLVLAPSAALAQTPSVAIVAPTESSVIYEGEPLLVKAQLSGDGIYKAVFYLNETKVTAVSYQNMVECKIVGAQGGTNVIRVDAVTAIGTVLATDSVTVTVSANSAPTVAVAAIDGGSTIDLAVTDKLEAVVTDSESNFSEATAYLNDVLVGTYTSDTFDVDIKNAASGENKLVINTVDTYGRTSVYTKTFIAKRSITTSLVNKNFDDYVSGNPSGFTNFVTNKGASFSAETTDDESYGTSLGLKAGTIEESQDVDAHLYLATDTGKQKFVIKASYYFPGNAENEYDATATLYFRAGNGSARELVDFDKNGKFKWYGVANSSTSYSLDTWYDLELYIDTNTGEYTAKLNGTQVVTNTNTHIRDLGISALRFGICTRTQHGAHPASDAGAMVYMDNISVDSIVAVPEISAVYSAGNTSTVDAGVSEICFKLSGNIVGTDILENLSVESEFGTVPVEAVTYDAATAVATVTLGAVVQPNADYSLKIKKGIWLVQDKLKTDSDIRCDFTATPDEVDAVDALFGFSGGKLCFNASIANDSAQAVDAIALMYIYKGNELVSVHTQNVNAAQNATTSFTITGKPLADGERAEAYVFELNNLDNPITVKKYSYSN